MVLAIAKPWSLWETTMKGSAMSAAGHAKISVLGKKSDA